MSERAMAAPELLRVEDAFPLIVGVLDFVGFLGLGAAASEQCHGASP